MKIKEFRGKDIDTGVWVFGSLLSNKIIKDVKNDKEYYLIFNREWDLDAQINYLKDPVGFEHCKESVCKVIPGSVGQYIEQKDDNGREMYEKDIIEDHYWNSMWFTKNIEVKIPDIYSWLFRRIMVKGSYYKIIGNTIDNPELLGKK